MSRADIIVISILAIAVAAAIIYIVKCRKKVMSPQKNIETEKSDKSQNSMDEMEYGSDTAKAKNPENIVNTEMNRNSEFSFDEDDDVPDEDTPKN